MEKGKYMIIMEMFYLMENIKMVREMEQEKNIIIIMINII